MRKLLLSTILLVAMVATSFAQSTEPITINLLTNSSASTWSGDASGFSTTMDGFSMEYLKASSTSNCIAPCADHIRLYKNSQFKISKVAGCPITK